jgi:Kef-type K+ transport system membrane component KefB
MELIEIAFALLVARVAALVLDRIEVPAITAYILTGIILGPSILGFMTGLGPDTLIMFSLLFLLFYTGLNVDFKGLGMYIKKATIITLLGVGTTVFLSIVVLTSMGFGILPTLVVAFCIANTATEVVVVMLEHSYGVSDEFKRILIMASFMDDILAIIFMSLIRASFLESIAVVSVDMTKLLLFFSVTLGVTYFIMKKLPRLVYPLVIDWSYLLILASAVFFGLVYVAYILGISEAFGAYIAGLVISMFRLVYDPTLVYEVRVEELVARMSTVLEFFIIPVFFIYVGFRTVAANIISYETLIILSIALAGKFIGSSILHLIKGKVKEGLTLGLAMNVRGSIEPALALVALERGIINTSVFSAIVSVSLITSAVIPVIFNIITMYEEV